MTILFDELAWEDYCYWQREDRCILERINQLIADMARNENEGIGKPEPLKYEWSGYWSRRITSKHRLVHRLNDDIVLVAAYPILARSMT
ncbi:Txe/YoeB family addiction module toxin [Nonomuraea sp. PA05]|uniref:Txe/YoeB family addiction module toxin n=1 Tax=Nonomuraea sp. PA05 TaxID=2604466 RepID=UPI0011DAFC8F|nr:Txe/YoeB family addiction module toxin [Nonomuraea sp. PA05]TYB59735.1 Txe/YoeB family addiction module toxin [Nonomuraea sp. PA05]